MTLTTKCKSGWYQGHRPNKEKIIENNYGTSRTICLDCKQSLVQLIDNSWRLDKSKSRLVR